MNRTINLLNFFVLSSSCALCTVKWVHKDMGVELITHTSTLYTFLVLYIQGSSNMTGTDLCVNKPHCAAAVRP